MGKAGKEEKGENDEKEEEGKGVDEEEGGGGRGGPWWAQGIESPPKQATAVSSAEAVGFLREVCHSGLSLRFLVAVASRVSPVIVRNPTTKSKVSISAMDSFSQAARTSPILFSNFLRSAVVAVSRELWGLSLHLVGLRPRLGGHSSMLVFSVVFHNKKKTKKKKTRKLFKWGCKFGCFFFFGFWPLFGPIRDLNKHHTKTYENSLLLLALSPWPSLLPLFILVFSPLPLFPNFPPYSLPLDL